LIADEPSMLVFDCRRLCKKTNPDEYKKQKRGGVGVVDLDTKDEDFITHFLTLRHTTTFYSLPIKKGISTKNV
jgi:DNA gyrase/topoisomerase IV subunit A